MRWNRCGIVVQRGILNSFNHYSAEVDDLNIHLDKVTTLTISKRADKRPTQWY